VWIRVGGSRPHSFAYSKRRGFRNALPLFLAYDLRRRVDTCRRVGATRTISSLMVDPHVRRRVACGDMCDVRAGSLFIFTSQLQSNPQKPVALLLFSEETRHLGTPQRVEREVKLSKCIFSNQRDGGGTAPQGETKARCHRRQNPHTYLTLHNIRIGKTPVGWAGSKQEAGQPERGIVSPGLVSFGGTPLSDLERSPSWTADGGRWSACQSDRRSKGPREKGHAQKDRRESGHRDL